jgi:hypothetical protein
LLAEKGEVGRNPKRYKANGDKKRGGGERWVVGMFEERQRGSFTWRLRE